MTLVGQPEMVGAYLSRTYWWLKQPKGTPVTETDVAEDAELANRLQAAFRVARERILSEPESETGKVA